jgi:hypothetical protein
MEHSNQAHSYLKVININELESVGKARVCPLKQIPRRNMAEITKVLIPPAIQTRNFLTCSALLVQFNCGYAQMNQSSE